MLIWGGEEEPYGGEALGDGAAYEPATGTWRVLAASPLPPRLGAASTWTGSELIVSGGIDRCGPVDSVIHAPEAASYAPATDAWEMLPPIPEPWSSDDGGAVSEVVNDQVTTPGGSLTSPPEGMDRRVLLKSGPALTDL